MKFNKLSCLKRVLARETILLVLCEDVEVSDDRIVITIEKDPPVAVTSRERREFEGQKEKWRWNAGGFGHILETDDARILLTGMRDEDAPTYANHDTIGTGLGGISALGPDIELRFPLITTVREGVEEFIIVGPDGFLMPTLPMPYSNVMAILTVEEIVKCNMRLSEPFLRGATLNRIIPVRSHFLNLPSAEKEVEVRWEGKPSTFTKGIVCFDEAVRGIDLLKVVVTKIPHRLDQIAVLDGETIGYPPKSLNRVINCYEVGRIKEKFRLTGKIIRSYQGGKVVASDKGLWPHPQTLVLKQVVEALSHS